MVVAIAGSTASGGALKKLVGGPNNLRCKLDDNNQIKINKASYI